jgi:hypothetical protein
MTRIYRYVPWHQVDDYFLLGWMGVPCRPHEHMDQYRAILCWPCKCRCVEPK